MKRRFGDDDASAIPVRLLSFLRSSMMRRGYANLRVSLLLGLTSLLVAAESGRRPPNVIFLLADDLGYAEIGAFGQTKIRTPHLDRLAAEGMRFTQHYSGSSVCAPSRCVLMTGLHPGHAHVRDNRRVGVDDNVPLPAGTLTVGRLFKSAGYATAAFGKWGLGGLGSTGEPWQQGFDEFHGYLGQIEAHNLFPQQLWRNRERIRLDNPPMELVPGGTKLPEGANPDAPQSYAGFRGKQYGPDVYSDEALTFIRRNRDRPFFLYYPTVVPHLAMQVPEDSLAEYEGLWPDPPYTGTNGYLPHRRPRAAYAAMVTRLDREVGRMVALVRDLGLERNTIFVFTSDNGPLYDRVGGTDSEFFQSTGGLKGFKGALYEGGIRVPMIIRWAGRIEAGTSSARVTGFEDWLPTLAELIGAPADFTGIDGISFAATLRGEWQPERPLLYREIPGALYGGQQAVRMGDWKGVRRELVRSNKDHRTIELYDLAMDRGETTDVAATHPRIVAQIARLMRTERVPSAIFPFPSLDGLSSVKP
jgi:arylsulfatase A